MWVGEQANVGVVCPRRHVADVQPSPLMQGTSRVFETTGQIVVIHDERATPATTLTLVK